MALGFLTLVTMMEPSVLDSFLFVTFPSPRRFLVQWVGWQGCLCEGSWPGLLPSACHGIRLAAADVEHRLRPL